MFSLNASAFSAKYLPANIPSFFRSSPVIKIGQLAVHQDFAGQKLGRQTIKDSIKTYKNIKKQIGCMGIAVDSIPDKEWFYDKYDFVKLDTPGKRTSLMYLSNSSLSAAQEKAKNIN